jgi:hypothetical protein
MEQNKTENPFAATMLIIKMALKYGGEIEAVAKALEIALNNKIKALSEKRYLDAARYRDIEVKRILDLTELLEKQSAGK